MSLSVYSAPFSPNGVQRFFFAVFFSRLASDWSSISRIIHFCALSYSNCFFSSSPLESLKLYNFMCIYFGAIKCIYCIRLNDCTANEVTCTHTHRQPLIRLCFICSNLFRLNLHRRRLMSQCGDDNASQQKLFTWNDCTKNFWQTADDNECALLALEGSIEPNKFFAAARMALEYGLFICSSNAILWTFIFRTYHDSKTESGVNWILTLCFLWAHKYTQKVCRIRLIQFNSLGLAFSVSTQFRWVAIC